MTTPAQQAFFWDSIGDNGEPPAFGVEEVEQIYDTLATDYPTALNPEIGARAVLRGIQILLANAAKLVTYKQNQSTENASDIFKHLMQLEGMWRANLAGYIDDAATTNAGWGAIVGGHPRRRVPRELDYRHRDWQRRNW